MKLITVKQTGYGRTWPEKEFGRMARQIEGLLKMVLRARRVDGADDDSVRAELKELLGYDYDVYVKEQP